MKFAITLLEKMGFSGGRKVFKIYLDKHPFQLYHNIMKKLNLHQVEEKLFSLNIKIFTPDDLRVMFNVSQRAVEGFLNYNCKKGAFVRLKKGFYTLKRNPASEFVIANKIYSPSYISLETALSYYHLIPETVYAVTSVTTKPTREFEVISRLFEYRKIKKEAYTGYLPKVVSNEVCLMAKPEKAVADSLYFVWLGKRTFNERLRLEKIDKTELRKYLRLFDQKKFIAFVDRLI